MAEVDMCASLNVPALSRHSGGLKEGGVAFTLIGGVTTAAACETDLVGISFRYL